MLKSRKGVMEQSEFPWWKSHSWIESGSVMMLIDFRWTPSFQVWLMKKCLLKTKVAQKTKILSLPPQYQMTPSKLGYWICSWSEVQFNRLMGLLQLLRRKEQPPHHSAKMWGDASDTKWQAWCLSRSFNQWNTYCHLNCDVSFSCFDKIIILE